MLNHPTHERRIAFGLHGMAKAFEEQRRQPDIEALGFDERLGLTVDGEAIEREDTRGDGRHARLLKTLARVQLLILDDWGLVPLAPEQRRDLLEIMDDSHGRAVTIVTSQLPVDAWHAAIGDPTLADAILDRLVHNAHRLTLKGDSMRKAAAKPAPLDPGLAA